ncbi:WD40-repeat-containing domain protein [Thelonectria olida]|uniref:WD40-repeat-containing domain protein n=1 Tax=Thelonectria olida TaxID=1576542 RepID=A0A9P9AGB9_9HYPO|nr:WD40-repeat-containing domain protein [Thelonectria olida]
MGCNKWYLSADASAGAAQLAFDSTGTIVVASSDCQVWHWDLKTGSSKYAQFESRRTAFNVVALSPDGKMLPSSGQEELTVQLRDNKGVAQKTFLGHQWPVDAIAFSRDGRVLASASPYQIRLWDGSGRTSGNCASSEDTPKAHTRRIQAVAFSPDGRTVASASSDHTIRLWSSDGVHQRVLKGHDNPVLVIAFSPKASLKTLESHLSNVFRVGFTPDGETVVSESSDCTLGLRNVDTGVVEDIWRVWHRDAYATAFSPDGKRIASGASYDLQLWDAITGQHDYFLSGHRDTVIGIASSSDSALVAGPLHPILSVAFSPDTKTLASASYHETIIWNLQTKVRQRTLENCTGPVAFSPDGKILVSGQKDGLAGIWDMATGSKRHNIDTNTLASTAFSLDGKIMATGSSDGSIQLWDLIADSTPTATLNGGENNVTALSFSLDAKMLASGSGGSTVRL